MVEFYPLQPDKKPLRPPKPQLDHDPVASQFFSEVDSSGVLNPQRLALRSSAHDLRAQAAAMRADLHKHQRTINQDHIDRLSAYSTAYETAADIAARREIKFDQLFAEAEAALADTKLPDANKKLPLEALLIALHSYKNELGAFNLMQVNLPRLHNLAAQLRISVSSNPDKKTYWSRIIADVVALCDRLAAYQTIDKSTNTGTAELSAIHQVSDDNDDASTDIATTADEDESFSDEMSQVA